MARLLTGAVRYEKYSDFGNTTTGKVTARWDPSKQVGVRGSFSSGFRAPGVQQAFYSSVSTNLNAEGVLTETLTARQNSPVTRALGIAPLRAMLTLLNVRLGYWIRRPPGGGVDITARALAHELAEPDKAENSTAPR